MFIQAMAFMMTANTLGHLIQEAVHLRSSGDCEKALHLLKQAEIKFPGSALVHYHTAWTYDKQGEEALAIPHYEKALQLGLSSEIDLKGCMIGLGSSYRCVGQFQKSLEIFEQARLQFPSCPALAAFEAFSVYQVRNQKSGMQNFCKAIEQESTECDCLKIYWRSISAYAEEIMGLKLK